MSITNSLMAAVANKGGGGLDADVVAFATESGATDLTGLNDLVVYLKAQSLYSDFAIYPMKSAQNAGSGSTVYSLGGLTTVDAEIAGGAPWTASGIDLNGTSHYLTSSVTGSSAWTEFSAGSRISPDNASAADAAFVFVATGDVSPNRFTYLGNGTSTLSGEILTIGFQAGGGLSGRKGNTTVSWSAAEDIMVSYNAKSLSMSFNSSTIPNNLSSGALTDYTPSRANGSDDSIYYGALKNGAGAVSYFAGVMAASWICDASLTDTQRHQIDTYVAAL